MSILFSPITVGSLTLRNRLMRSATAERLADPNNGAPLPKLAQLYRELAEGGIGLIVTGHVYVDRRGKAHPEMAALDNDALIPRWREIIAPAQAAGAKVMVQINYGGASCDSTVTPDSLSPSGVPTNESNPNPGVMTDDDVQALILAFGQAARRAVEAGFDGVQIHGAHGYITSQFLTPSTNLRTDRWGGSAEKRLTFLRALCTQVRDQVGDDYPVWIKLGVAGEEAHGFALEDGVVAAVSSVETGVDSIELSHALGTPSWAGDSTEPPFLKMAEAVRAAVGDDFPLALVNGIRDKSTMESLVTDGGVQLVSLCRPLIVEPDLPNKLQSGISERASCARCSQCWPNDMGEGIACHNRSVRKRLALPV